MKLNRVAFIFCGFGLDPKIHRTEISTGQFALVSVGIDINHLEQSLVLAKELVAEGVQMIELCGGFGPIWMAKISEALGPTIPIGGVFYGPEMRKPILNLLQD